MGQSRSTLTPRVELEVAPGDPVQLEFKRSSSKEFFKFMMRGCGQSKIFIIDACTSSQHLYRGASAKLIIMIQVCLFYPVESRPTPIHSLRFLAAGGPRLRRDALDLAADGLGELGRCSLHAKGAFFEEPIWNLCETQPVTVVHRRRGRENRTRHSPRHRAGAVTGTMIRSSTLLSPSRTQI